MARTAKEVLEDFARKGISVAAWARSKGYDADLTRAILRKERAAIRGQSHNIAVELGLKDGEVVRDHEIATAINA
ncbi:DNA-binding protein [Maridesulfovibrio sp.]|uniref:DNA-binding protein n=1 Tax=Maridesulfovibrio sp. TaxID=2795000 RepID=UPI0029CAA44E|nr:DNA-binding protein [Maridesulfovibrio sp.]